MRRLGVFLSHAVGAVRRLALDGRIPRPVRWAVVFALLPIPGPVDEFVLVLVAAVLWLFWRDELAEAWREEEAPRT